MMNPHPICTLPKNRPIVGFGVILQLPASACKTNCTVLFFKQSESIFRTMFYFSYVFLRRKVLAVASAAIPKALKS